MGTHAGRIVVGIDGSESSNAALDWAADLAQKTGQGLTLICAWSFPNTYGWAAPLPADYDPEKDATEFIEKQLERVRSAYSGIDVKGETVEDHAAPALVEASKGAALLVVGSRGHGEFAGMLLGSVSEYCTGHAHCPVMVHRSKK
jgi:nucleotide-binding universal stress UspA family protein